MDLNKIHQSLFPEYENYAREITKENRDNKTNKHKKKNAYYSLLKEKFMQEQNTLDLNFFCQNNTNMDTSETLFLESKKSRFLKIIHNHFAY